jgi:hypothetical protein
MLLMFAVQQRRGEQTGPVLSGLSCGGIEPHPVALLAAARALAGNANEEFIEIIAIPDRYRQVHAKRELLQGRQALLVFQVGMDVRIIEVALDAEPFFL